jgi:hypothetical protein
MYEETAEILNTTTKTKTNTNTTTTTNNNNKNNRFSLKLRYLFLKSFMAKVVNSVTAGHCDDRSAANFG